MACTMKRQDVSNIVVDVISEKEHQDVNETTRLGTDLIVNEARRRGYFPPVKGRIQGKGCDLTKTTSDVFVDKSLLSDIVDVLWDDVRAQTSGTEAVHVVEPADAAATKKRRVRRKK